MQFRSADERPVWERCSFVPPQHVDQKSNHVVWIPNRTVQSWAKHEPEEIQAQFDWEIEDRLDFKYPKVHEYGKVVTHQYYAQGKVVGCGPRYNQCVPLVFFVSETSKGKRRIGAFTKKAHIRNEYGEVFAAFPRVDYNSGSVMLHEFLKFLDTDPGLEHMAHLTDVAQNLEHAQCVFMRASSQRMRAPEPRAEAEETLRWQKRDKDFFMSLHKEKQRDRERHTVRDADRGRGQWRDRDTIQQRFREFEMWERSRRRDAYGTERRYKRETREPRQRVERDKAAMEMQAGGSETE